MLNQLGHMFTQSHGAVLKICAIWKTPLLTEVRRARLAMLTPTLLSEADAPVHRGERSRWLPDPPPTCVCRSTPIQLQLYSFICCTVCGCFCATLEELFSADTEHMVHKAKPCTVWCFTEKCVNRCSKQMCISISSDPEHSLTFRKKLFLNI